MLAINPAPFVYYNPDTHIGGYPDGGAGGQIKERFMVKYPIKCAWCKSQRIVGWSTVEHSHGICIKHKEMVLKKANELRAPKTEELFGDLETGGSFPD